MFKAVKAQNPKTFEPQRSGIVTYVDRPPVRAFLICSLFWIWSISLDANTNRQNWAGLDRGNRLRFHPIPISPPISPSLPFCGLDSVDAGVARALCAKVHLATGDMDGNCFFHEWAFVHKLACHDDRPADADSYFLC